MEQLNRSRPLALILDDEPGILRLCQRLLERSGFQVVGGFSNPLDALAALESQSVDLLLVDIRMPVMDGFQVIELARQRVPDLAVVVMTGFGNVETAIEALRRGADGLILKPFSADELVQSVKAALEQSRHKQDKIRLQALRPLFDITETLFTETNPKRLQTLILNAVCGHLHCSHAEFYTSRTGGSEPESEKVRRMRLIGSLHYPDGRTRVENHRPATGVALEGIARRVLSIRAPLLIQVEGTEEPYLQELLTNRGLGCVLCAPVGLKAGSDSSVLGTGAGDVLLAGRDQDEPRFREADLELFVILARQAGVAFENARLHAVNRATIQQLEESQRALVQAEKMAIAGRLTASIAHEINNPLQAVQNCVHLAGQRKLKAAQRQAYLQMAGNELERLRLTVQRMLDFYRPVAVARKPIDLNQLIRHVLALMDKQLSDEGVSVRCDLMAELPRILGVSDQIQQVLLNLVLNAVEEIGCNSGSGSIEDLYISSNDESNDRNRGGVIYIETGINPRNGKEVELLIEDSGPGIPPSQRKQIFEPFVSSKDGGTGLGLTVSYGIVTAHGGSLDLVEQDRFYPNKDRQQGACFRITLPVASEEEG